MLAEPFSRPPGELSPEVMDQVKGAMSLPFDPDRHVLPQEYLVPDTFLYHDPWTSKDEARLFSGDIHLLEVVLSKRIVNYSLLAQLPKLLEFDPEAIYFTAWSAIPCADAVRGIYQAIDRPMPKLDFVNTEWARSDMDRLNASLEGRTRVTIVDEHVVRGSTLDDARILLSQAGATALSCVIGRWYNNANILTMDPVSMTSDYQADMLAIGQDIARAAQI